jgi:hypothetical protein
MDLPLPLTLSWPSRVVAVGALISLTIEADGLNGPLLFLPVDFRRLGVEPRLGDRWNVTLDVDLDARTVRGVRMVALARP